MLAIETERLNNPLRRVLVVEMSEPDITEELRNRSQEMLDYTKGSESLTSEQVQIRSDLAQIAKKLDALEALKNTMSQEDNRRLIVQLLEQLAAIRAAHPDCIVHNEPEKWIRTAANDSDILLQYAIEKTNFRFFGILLYTELDHNTCTYIKNNWSAVDAITWPNLLLFAFDNAKSLIDRNRVLAQKVVIDTEKARIAANEGVELVSELEKVRSDENLIINHVYTRNDSAHFARRIGLSQAQLPCLVIFADLADKDLIVYRFQDSWVKSGEFTEHLKEIVDITARASQEQKSDATLARSLFFLKARKWLARQVSEISLRDAIKEFIPLIKGDKKSMF